MGYNGGELIFVNATSEFKGQLGQINELENIMQAAGKEGVGEENNIPSFNSSGSLKIINDDLFEIKQFTKELLDQKPQYSPIPDTWQNKGGRITVDSDGVWTYHDWEGHSVSYPDGYPDFRSAEMVKQEVKIDIFESYSKDFSKADALAPNGPRADTSTWHHHQDMMTMQEVDQLLHDRFRHKGGMSRSRKK